MNPIRFDTLYYGAFALQWIALLAAYSIENINWLFIGGVLGGCLIAASLRIGKNSKNSHDHANTALTHIAMLLVFFMAFLIWPILGGDLAALHFLMGLLLASNLSLITRRNLYFTYIGTFFVVVYAASRGSNSIFVIWITLYVLAGVFTLMAAHMDARLDAAQAQDESSSPYIAKWGVILVSITVLLTTSIIYLFFPRLPPSQLSIFPSAGGTNYDADATYRDHNKDGTHKGGTGISTQVNDNNVETSGEQKPLDASGSSDTGTNSGVAKDQTMFYLQSNYPLYMRTNIYDHFDGWLWRYTKSREVAIYRPQNHFIFDEQKSILSNKLVTQRYIIKAYNESNLPLAAKAVSIHFPGNTLYLNREGIIRSPRSLEEGTVYLAKSYQLEVFQHLADGTGNHEISRERYLQLPNIVRDSNNIAQLAAHITAKARTNMERAIAIERYLRQHYPYTLSTYGYKPKAGLVEWFLFEQEQGHCELYASSMVMMLRQQGIPARFVTGYVAETPNPITGLYELKNLKHAWVEAWLPIYGWVTFEPTANWGDLELSFSPMLIVSLMQYIEQQMQDTIRQQELSNDNYIQWWTLLLNILQWLWQSVMALFTLAVLFLGALWGWLLTFGIWLLAFLLASTTAYILFWPWLAGILARGRLRLANKQSAATQISLCWYEVERGFMRIGYPRLKAMTIDEYQQQLAKKMPQTTSLFAPLSENFQHVRYWQIDNHYEKNKQDERDNKNAKQALDAAHQLLGITMRPAWALLTARR